MTTPNLLTSISPSVWHNDYEYRFRTASSTHAFYDLWKKSDSNWQNSGDAYRIKVGISGADYNNWSDVNTNNEPADVNDNSDGTITLQNSTTILYRFTKPTTNASWYVAGPTVTSHEWIFLTNNAKVITNDTIQGSDFTFLKNNSSYSPSNFNLTAISNGYVYDYTQNDTAMYTATIDSKSIFNFYVDESWITNVSGLTSGRNTTSNRILNALGKIPSNTTMSSTSFTLVKDTNASSDRYIRWYSTDGGVNSDERNHNYGMYVTTTTSDVKIVFYYYPEGFAKNITYSSEFSIGNQATMSYTAGGHTITVQDWIHGEPEGSGYSPVSNNGGGKPDRYPLIMTNLFNRNRSLYSIGMTHKDTWDLFL